MRNLSLQQFLEYIEDIYIAAFLRDVCRDANQHISDHSELSTNICQPVTMSSSSVDILGSTANNYNMEFFNHI